MPVPQGALPPLQPDNPPVLQRQDGVVRILAPPGPNPVPGIGLQMAPFPWRMNPDGTIDAGDLAVFNVRPEIVLDPRPIAQGNLIENIERRNAYFIPDVLVPDLSFYLWLPEALDGLIHPDWILFALICPNLTFLPARFRLRRMIVTIPRTQINSILIWMNDKDLQAEDFDRVSRAYANYLVSRSNYRTSAETQMASYHLPRLARLEFLNLNAAARVKALSSIWFKPMTLIISISVMSFLFYFLITTYRRLSLLVSSTGEEIVQGLEDSLDWIVQPITQFLRDFYDLLTVLDEEYRLRREFPERRW